MQTTTIKIQGMTCGGCVNSIKTVLEKLPGVTQAEVSLESEQAIVQHDAANTSIAQLKEAITDAGFDVID